MSQVIVGIDGGGTKTECLAADLSGRILGQAFAGPSNYQAVGLEAATANILAAAAQACATAGCQRSDVVAACVGLAGAGRPEDTARIKPALSVLHVERLQIVSDARIALAGALGEQPGIVVISGTGSIVYGVDRSGRTVRVGGWGWILDDRGSGYDIGRQAVCAALEALDGVGPDSLLVEKIRRYWRLEHLAQLVPYLYADPGRARTELAALVPLVVEASHAGDVVARRVLTEAGQHLGRMAQVAIRRLALQEPTIALAGGVLTASSEVREALRTAVAAGLPHADIIDSPGSAASGAVRLALQLVQAPS